MAFLDRSFCDQGELSGHHLNYVYNVTSGVGSRLTNHREDVAMVQLLLNAVLTHQNWPASNDPIATDGRFGPQTEAAIRSFQAGCEMFHGEGIKVDGKVHRATSERFGKQVETMQGLESRYYTIVLLNKFYARWYWRGFVTQGPIAAARIVIQSKKTLPGEAVLTR